MRTKQSVSVRAALLAFMQHEVAALCRNDATVLPRTFVVVKNELQLAGGNAVSGILLVKALYRASTSSMQGHVISHGVRMGVISYAIRLDGALQ